jgi:hypothetical protein
MDANGRSAYTHTYIYTKDMIHMYRNADFKLPICRYIPYVRTYVYFHPLLTFECNGLGFVHMPTAEGLISERSLSVVATKVDRESFGSLDDRSLAERQRRWTKGPTLLPFPSIDHGTRLWKGRQRNFPKNELAHAILKVNR